MRVRVITINVAGVKEGWHAGRFDALVAGLRRAEPDIVFLQEATVCHGTTLYDQTREVADALGLAYGAFAPYGNVIETMTQDEGGIAFASRFPLRRMRNRRLPTSHAHPTDARVAIFASVDTSDGPIRIATTHLSWKPEETEIRLVQMGLILSELSQRGWFDDGARTIVAGDLNAQENEPVIELMRERMQDAWRAKNPHAPGHTWLASNPLAKGWTSMPDRRLDYVFCSHAATVTRAELVLDKPEPVLPSDHVGLLVELEF